MVAFRSVAVFSSNWSRLELLLEKVSLLADRRGPAGRSHRRASQWWPPLTWTKTLGIRVATCNSPQRSTEPAALATDESEADRGAKIGAFVLGGGNGGYSRNSAAAVTMAGVETAACCVGKPARQQGAAFRSAWRLSLSLSRLDWLTSSVAIRRRSV